jgi:hypothetical protein
LKKNKTASPPTSPNPKTSVATLGKAVGGLILGGAIMGQNPCKE